MKSINVSKKAFDKLKVLNLPSEVTNTESKLYLYNFRNQEKLIKRLYKTSGEYFATKLYTVAMLNEYKDNLPDNFIVPDYNVSINHENIGFSIPLVHGITLATILKDKNISPLEQIDYLKQVGYTLRQLESIRKYTRLNSLYLNDINESNFIVTPQNRGLYVIDLDSAKLENNRIFPAQYLSKKGLLSQIPKKYKRNESAWNQTTNNEPQFNEGYYIPDSNTDLYCYSILILNYLYGSKVNNFTLEEFYNYLGYLQDIGLNKGLIDCLANIVNKQDNYNPVDYLDSLTQEQIYRSRHPVYNCVLKKKK